MMRFLGIRFVRIHVALYRLMKGRVVSFGGRILLLETVGARSGLQRVSPVMCVQRQNGDLAVAGSAAGEVKHPAWVHNIRANPRVAVQRGSDRFSAHARFADEPERSMVYKEFEEIAPPFREYPKKTDRVIPIIFLERL
jgi:deazaflavin-dependent oxidoreductase (nitroreductase family)